MWLVKIHQKNKIQRAKDVILQEKSHWNYAAARRLGLQLSGPSLGIFAAVCTVTILATSHFL